MFALVCCLCLLFFLLVVVVVSRTSRRRAGGGDGCCCRCCSRLVLLLSSVFVAFREFSGFVKGLGWVCGVGRRIGLVLCRVWGRNLRFRCGLDG